MCLECGKKTGSPNLSTDHNGKPNYGNPLPKAGAIPPASLQPQLTILSNAICSLYAAYYDTKLPSLKLNPIVALNKHFPSSTWTNITPIFVYELDPDDWIPAISTDSSTQKPSTSTALLPQCAPGLSSYNTTTDRSQLFGFTATYLATKPATNVLVLRGTVTRAESKLSIFNWDTLAPVNLPTKSGNTTPMGNVKKAWWDFYSTTIPGQATLAASLKNAVTQTLKSSPNLPWMATAHSMGGAMLCLGILDCIADGLLTSASRPMTVATFGSVVVGDATFAANWNTYVNPPGTSIRSQRVANLSDFVPALRSLLPPTAAAPAYVHVGDTILFVWELDGDWDNHSMLNVYIPFVSNTNYFKGAYFGGAVNPMSVTPIV